MTYSYLKDGKAYDKYGDIIKYDLNGKVFEAGLGESYPCNDYPGKCTDVISIRVNSLNIKFKNKAHEII